MEILFTVGNKKYKGRVAFSDKLFIPKFYEKGRWEPIDDNVAAHFIGTNRLLIFVFWVGEGGIWGSSDADM